MNIYISVGGTHAVAIHEGHVIPNSFVSKDLCSRDITEYLQKILSEAGIDLVTSAEREIVRHMKVENGRVKDVKCKVSNVTDAISSD